ncbi:hypothetical protein EKO04_006265 [Ascochyta lentis]|uniref:RNA-directed DNA polymerase n=1 Tax=Ascochyta lentis TaxID=205686 RepID=A0A8H7J3W5_9PLEO|nr:hypothetical protein EKO04_006265 [Ascochyta lentis]
MKIDIDGHRETLWAYVLDGEREYDLILGRPWMDKNEVTIALAKKSLFIHSSRTRPVSPELYQALRKRSKTDRNIELFSALMADIQKALKKKELTDPRDLLPEFLKDEFRTFMKEEADKLAPHRGPDIDHAIELIEQDGKPATVLWGPLYNMSREELLSSASAPVLFVKKPGGGLWFCVDYRALNAITKKDRYPLPLIHETLSQISKATWFTKVDVIQAFHKIRIAKGDEWKTAFRTRFGLYEWLVTLFGLANAPRLHLDVGKSEFSVKSTKYLGFIIEAGKGIRMDPAKVAAIKSWEPLKTVKGIRSFLGFANFYRQFISQFSSMAEPLTRLTGKNATFEWGEPQQRAFDAMKAAFTREPALANFDPDLETVLECDASGWATGGVLSQYGKDKVLRTVAYFSAKNSKAEVNYTIHDKEMLAVIKCLQEWSTELKQVKGFTVVTDHKNLEYFCKAQLLSERHVRWSSLLSQFNLTFAYRPGKVNNRADALSRKEEDVPPSTGDERTKTRQFQLLKPFARVVKTGLEDDSANDIQVFSSGLRRADRLLPVTPPNEEPRENRHEKPEQTREETPLAGNSEPYDSIEEFETLWKNAAKNDKTYQLAKSSISLGARKFPVQLNLKVSLSECSVDDRDRLCYRGRVWVPNSDALRTKIINDAHHSLIAGHPGRGNMYAILSRAYFWPGMSTALRRYVENCDICGRTKPWRELKQGLLKPLPLPDRIWKEISMDFITDLPESEGNYNLMVVTDRLSKDIILVPLPDLSVKTVTRAFISNVVGHHWLPNAIVSDRGTQFLSDFWQTMCQLLKITRRLSTAFHPQTDGSTERMNSVVEAYLRAYINWAQDDWSAWVPMAQIAIKGRVATSTGFSPFFLQHGYDVDPVQIDPDLAAELLHRHAREPTRAAASMVQKFAETIDFVKAQMAEAQQVQERQANAHRREAPQLKVGDKVWLKLGNQFSNGRASRKLDWKNRKFTVVEVISPHNVKLDVDGKVHPVFHVDRLKLCPQDPLHGQSNDDPQPGPLVITNDDGTSSEEWKVDSICGERRSGRGVRDVNT